MKSILDLTKSCLENVYISQSEFARNLCCSRQNVNIAWPSGKRPGNISVPPHSGAPAKKAPRKAGLLIYTRSNYRL